MWAYRFERHSPLRERKEWALFYAACVFYAIIFAGVAVNFPAGLTVALTWLAIYAVPLAAWLYRQKDNQAIAPNGFLRRFWRPCLLFSPGKCLVLQYYLASYALSFVIIVIYLIVFGYKDRASAGIALK
jgi:hypothetical protein